tara:strand:- start:1005 stop:1523 length:519 start_codon:yes stop_codon:yes gene_type:complete
MTDKWGLGYVDPIWDKEYINLTYIYEKFNNPTDTALWKNQGYVLGNELGALCDMRSPQPSWNQQIVNWFSNKYQVQDIGTSYYRMSTGVVLPTHGDTYEKYRQLFGCKLEDIKRVVLFLEDWKSGHYFEIDGNPVINWRAGDYVWWTGDLKHMAANIGLEDRYTLQVTGHVK